MPERLVIGGVKYLNARPLVHGLAEAPDVELRLGPPSALPELFRRGTVDAALLPAIAYYRLSVDPGERARPLGGRAALTAVVALRVAAITSDGPVGSVRLFGYTDLEKVRRVRLDPSSRTSNTLARLLLGARRGRHPHFIVPRPGEEPDPEARPPDAELLIGDRGLAADASGAAWEWDLGLEWKRAMHRPFVYAFWVARPEAPLDRLTEILSAARDRGLAAREAIADEAAREIGVPAEVARRHLLEQVGYAFGSKEQQGLRTFYEMARDEGLAPEGGRLRFPRGEVPQTR